MKKYLLTMKATNSALDDDDDNLEEENPDYEYEDEGAEKASSSALFEKLLKHRLIIISSEIECSAVARVVAQLLYLDREDPQTEIKIFINSPGGTVDDGFAIYDMVKFISAPVKIICTGLTASAAALILLAASPQNRLALPNARIMIHQPAVGVQGTAADIKISAEEVLKIRARANQLIANETGQPLAKVEKDTNRDFWMTAAEAKEYGLIGRIVAKYEEL